MLRCGSAEQQGGQLAPRGEARGVRKPPGLEELEQLGPRAILVPRPVAPDDLQQRLCRLLPPPGCIQRRGQVSPDEMVRVFNCGLGMVVAVDPDAADAALSLAHNEGITATIVGEVRAGNQKVVLA